jgi:phage shock protein A
MRRDLDSAHATLRRVDADLGEARRALAREGEDEARCHRQAGLARQIGDDETARVAAEYAARHAERAAIIRQKLNALTAERELLGRDLDSMRKTFAELAPGMNPEDQPRGTTSSYADGPVGNDTAFRRLEEEARERAAEARLEELKRKLR